MKSKPQEAWAKMWNLQAGHNPYHKIIQVLNFAKNGVKALNNKENLKIASEHFEKVYNRESSYDPNVVNNIPQYPESPNFNQLPSIVELNDPSLIWPPSLPLGTQAYCP